MAGGSKIVIGADTGLGSAFIFYSKENTHVIAGEAGHSDFAARNKTEFKLAQFIKTKFELAEFLTLYAITYILMKSYKVKF